MLTNQFLILILLYISRFLGVFTFICMPSCDLNCILYMSVAVRWNTVSVMLGSFQACGACSHWTRREKDSPFFLQKKRRIFFEGLGNFFDQKNIYILLQFFSFTAVFRYMKDVPYNSNQEQTTNINFFLRDQCFKWLA